MAIKKQGEIKNKNNIQSKDFNCPSDDFFIAFKDSFFVSFWQTDTKGNIISDFSQGAIACDNGKNALTCWQERIHPNDLPGFLKVYKNSLRLKKKFVFSYNLKDEKGKYQRVLNLASPKIDNQGKFLGFWGICHNISELEKSELDLNFNNNLTDKYLNLATIGFLSLDRGAKVLKVNKKLCEITGYSEKELLGANWIDLMVPAEIKEQIKKVFIKIMEGELEQAENYKNQVIGKNGKKIILQWHNTLLLDTDDKIEGVVSFCEDITKQEEDKVELIKLKNGIEKTNEAVFITNPDGVITYINPAFEKIYGYTSSEAIGKTPRILKSGLLNEEAYKGFWQTILGKQVLSGELINKRKNGEFITVSGSVNPVLDEAGKIIAFLAIQQDVSNFKKTENDLRQAGIVNQTILDNIPFGIYLINNNKIEYVNQSMVEISLAKSADDWLNKDLFSFSSYDNELGRQIKIAITEKTKFEIGPIDYITFFSQKRQKRIFSGIPLLNEKGELSRYLLFVRDVTESEKRQEELERFNDLMVGREMRMVELKKEIDELKKIIKTGDFKVKTEETSKTKIRNAIIMEEKFVKENIGFYIDQFKNSDISDEKKNRIVELLNILLVDSERHEASLINLSQKNEID